MDCGDLWRILNFGVAITMVHQDPDCNYTILCILSADNILSPAYRARGNATIILVFAHDIVFSCWNFQFVVVDWLRLRLLWNGIPTFVDLNKRDRV